MVKKHVETMEDLIKHIKAHKEKPAAAKVVSERPNVTAELMKDKQKCPECKAFVHKNHNVCPECGSGLLDLFKVVKKAVTSIVFGRTDYPPRVRSFLDLNGNSLIQSMTNVFTGDLTIVMDWISEFPLRSRKLRTRGG